MEKFPPSSYLEDKIEPRRSAEEKSHYTSEDLGYGYWLEHNKDYPEATGSWEARIGETEVSFSYVSPTAEEIMADLNKLERKDKAKVKALIPSEVIHTIRKVKELRLANAHGKFSSLEGKNGKDAPHIYFNVPLVDGSAFSYIANSVFLEEDPLSRKGLLTLFHELGHFNDHATHSQEELEGYEEAHKRANYLSFKFLSSRRLTKEQAALMLKAERNAWAFCLKTLQPFAEDLDLDLNNSLETIHAHSLQSYADMFRSEIKTL